MMKVQLVFECDVAPLDTQYDFLHIAVAELKRKMREADSMDDLAEVFRHMYINGRKEW